MLVGDIEKNQTDPASLPEGERRAREAEFAFNALLSSIGQFNPERDAVAVQQITDANHRALANQRIAQDDLRRADAELDRRQAFLRGGRHAFREGSVAVARGQLGLGRMAYLFDTPPADNTARSLAQDVSAQGRQASNHQTNGDRDPATLPHAQKPGTPAEPAGAEARSQVPLHAERGQNLQQDHGTRAPGATATRVLPQPPEESSKAAKLQVQKPQEAPQVQRVSAAVLKIAGSAGQGGGQNQQPSEFGMRPENRSPTARTAASASKVPFQTAMEAQQKTVDDVLRVVRSNLGKQRSEIKLRLHPPELGRLSIEMTMNKGSLKLEIEAENAAVRQLLVSSASSLSDALRGQDISIEQYDVRLAAHADTAPFDAHDSQPGRDHSSGTPLGAEEGERDEPADVPSAVDPAEIIGQERLDIRA